MTNDTDAGSMGRAAAATATSEEPEELRIQVAPTVSLAVLLRRPAATTADAVPFLLVHGLASNARLWDGVARALAESGHPVAAVDLRGHGRSDRPDEGYDFATISGDLASVVDSLGFDRPVAVGQSWGADVVLETAVARSGLLRAVGLVDGGVGDLADRFPTWEACREALAPPRLDGLALDAVEARVRSAHPDWPAWGIEAVLANFDVRPDRMVSPRLSRERHLRILRALWEHRPSLLYPVLGVPALLMPAETADATRTAGKREAVAAALAANPLVDVRWFSPADHDVHVQQAPAVAAALLDALARWSAG